MGRIWSEPSPLVNNIEEPKNQKIVEPKYNQSPPNSLLKNQLTVATLNYGGVMLSPFQFITETFENDLNQMSEIFVHLLKKYVIDFNQKTFTWGKDNNIEKMFKKERYSPLYNISVGIEEGKFISKERFLQQWEKVYQEKCPPAIKNSPNNQQKDQIKLLDLVSFHTLLIFVYKGKERAFENLIIEKPDEYLKKLTKLFDQSFLSTTKKLQKFKTAFLQEKNEADVYIIEEYSQEFEDVINSTGNYFKAIDRSKDVMVLARKDIFKGVKNCEILRNRLDKEDQKDLQNMTSVDGIATLFVDNYIIVGVHFTSRPKQNQERVEDFKKFLFHLRRCFPQEQIICAGDINSYLEYDEKYFEKNFHLFPADKNIITTSKKRSMMQAQYSKGNQVVNESKDKIISTLEFLSKKVIYINGTESNPDSYLPTDDHPFDHFVVIASISLRIPSNQSPRKYYKSTQKKEKDLKVATINYGGIMYSPFEFYTNKFIKQLNEIGSIFLRLLPLYFPDFNPKTFKWDTGKVEIKFKKDRYCPLYNPEVGINNNKFLNLSQFQMAWEVAYDKCPEEVKQKTSESQKKMCYLYDFIAFHALLAFVYGEKKDFKQLINCNPQEYLSTYENLFNLSFLNQTKKLKRFQNAFDRTEADIFFVQEYSHEFVKKIDQSKYFRSSDSEGDTLVLASKKIFKKQNYLQDFQQGLNPEDAKKLNYLKSPGIAAIFLDNFIIFGIHLSSKKDLNPSQVKDLKACIRNLKRLLPNHHIICGGDINSFLEYSEELSPKQINCFPTKDSETTTVKKRTFIQAQFHKANKLVIESKDKIFSSLPFKETKIAYVDGSQVEESCLIPTDDHPFDHFLVTATIEMN